MSYNYSFANIIYRGTKVLLEDLRREIEEMGEKLAEVRVSL
jgi:hypothetical protein